MDGRMAQFYVLFNSISIISGRLEGDNEKLCAMKSSLQLKRSPPEAGLEPTTQYNIIAKCYILINCKSY